MTALATAEPEVSADLLRRPVNEEMKAHAVTAAPHAALDNRVVAAALGGLGDRGTDLASVIAAWRMLTGKDDPARRRLARTGPSGLALMEVFGAD